MKFQPDPFNSTNPIDMDPVVSVTVSSKLEAFPLLRTNLVLVGQLVVQHGNRVTRKQLVVDGTFVFSRVINSELGLLCCRIVYSKRQKYLHTFSVSFRKSVDKLLSSNWPHKEFQILL
ncbi:hypothetical protein DJ69_15255 [Halorubrum persicum]|uniref:Uncharacterized protein n=1 Tax=Halorubrum persicum TaxID=1383844 RepID=A0A2G1WFY5_9EURY|nr:hypothetical protein DJ69_15255 [Halorubrum persicum]